MGEMSLSSPWASYAKEVEALFKEDPEISVVYDGDTPEIKLHVDNQEKADALSKLLPEEKRFGNVFLKITIVPENECKSNKADLFKKAFDRNPALAFIKVKQDIVGTPLTYVLFAKRVVQYFNDNLYDLYGLKSTLYQDIAKNVFKDLDGVFFGTTTGE